MDYQVMIPLGDDSNDIMVKLIRDDFVREHALVIRCTSQSAMKYHLHRLAKRVAGTVDNTRES